MSRPPRHKNCDALPAPRTRYRHAALDLQRSRAENALLKDGSKSDRIDARKLADLLRGNYLKPVYHGENSLHMLKELSRT